LSSSSIFETPSSFKDGDYFRYQKAKLLNFLLLLSITAFLLSSIVNLFFLNQNKLAVISFTLSCLLTASLFYFRKKGGLQLPSVVVVTSLATILIWIILNSKGQSDAGALLILFPLISYQLLNSKFATFLFISFSILILSIITNNIDAWKLISPLSSLLNSSISLALGGVIVFLFKNGIEHSLESNYQQATTDLLTKTFNRATLLKLINMEIKRSSREKKTFSLIMLEVDHFKNIHAQFGQQKSDSVLVEFSALIAENIRETDLLSRWSNEGFMLLLPNTDTEGSKIKADKILSRISQKEFMTVSSITACAGIVEYKSDETAVSCFARVENALNQAKKNGSNSFITSF